MFAGKVHTTEMSAKEFKNGNDVKSTKKCLISACTAGKKKSTGSAQKSLLEAFDSSEDEEAQGQQQYSSTEESDDSSSDDSPSHDSSDSSSEESESSGGEETAKTKSSNVPASNDMNKIGSEEATEDLQLPLESLRTAKRGKKRTGEKAAEDFQPLPNEQPPNDVVEIEEVQPKKHKKNK